MIKFKTSWLFTLLCIIPVLLDSLDILSVTWAFSSLFWILKVLVVTMKMSYRHFHLSTYPCGSTKLHHISIIDLYPWYRYYWSWSKVVDLLLRIMKLGREGRKWERE